MIMARYANIMKWRTRLWKCDSMASASNVQPPNYEKLHCLSCLGDGIFIHILILVRFVLWRRIWILDLEQEESGIA